jgi:hypothetical protein
MRRFLIVVSTIIFSSIGGGVGNSEDLSNFLFIQNCKILVEIFFYAHGFHPYWKDVYKFS